MTGERDTLRRERDDARAALRRIADPTNHHHKPGWIPPEESARRADRPFLLLLAALALLALAGYWAPPWFGAGS